MTLQFMCRIRISHSFNYREPSLPFAEDTKKWGIEINTDETKAMLINNGGTGLPENNLVMYNKQVE